MFQVPLATLANQSISFNVDGAYWQIRLFQCVSMMHADISRDGVKLIDSVRCFSGIPVLPYRHLHLPNFGNFVFDSDPDWTEFGTSCRLFYLTTEELAAYNALVEAG